MIEVTLPDPLTFGAMIDLAGATKGDAIEAVYAAAKEKP